VPRLLAAARAYAMMASDKEKAWERRMAEYRVVAQGSASRRLLHRYLQRRRAEIGELRESLHRGDFEPIRRVGHNLFGSGAAYDLPRISTLGQRLERAAQRRQGAEIAALIMDLENFLNCIVLAPES